MTVLTCAKFYISVTGISVYIRYCINLQTVYQKGGSRMFYQDEVLALQELELEGSIEPTAYSSTPIAVTALISGSSMTCSAVVSAVSIVVNESRASLLCLF